MKKEYNITFRLDRGKKYSRIDSILYENDKPIIKFHQHFPVDIKIFNDNNIKYHEIYISSNPSLIENIKEDKPKVFELYEV